MSFTPGQQHEVRSGYCMLPPNIVHGIRLYICPPRRDLAKRRERVERRETRADTPYAIRRRISRAERLRPVRGTYLFLFILKSSPSGTRKNLPREGRFLARTHVREVPLAPPCTLLFQLSCPYFYVAHASQGSLRGRHVCLERFFANTTRTKRGAARTSPPRARPCWCWNASRTPITARAPRSVKVVPRRRKTLNRGLSSSR